MSYRTDDITPLLVKPAGQQVDKGQGVLLVFDKETLANQVQYRGSVLTNLQVRSGTDMLTWRPGDVVSVESKGGSAVITGRDLIPGTGQAARAVEFMRGELAKSIAKLVIAEATTTDQIPLAEGTVSNPGAAYVAADGPVLTDVAVTEAGTCLLWLTARIACQINQPTGVSAKGWMSFRITGATTVEPADDEALANELFGPAADVVASAPQASRLVIVEGLNAGLHTIEARYRSEGVDPPPQTSVIFSSRNLTALAL